MHEEIFDVVDEHDQVIDQRPRSEVHRLHLRHRSTHVLVFNQRGEVFLQQRSLLKDCSPGVWDSSASGHLAQGESYDDSVLREVEEELGVTLPSQPSRLFKLPPTEETGFEFCWIYKSTHEGPFQLQASEVRGGGWFQPEAVTEWIERRPSDFASAFLAVWRTFLASHSP